MPSNEVIGFIGLGVMGGPMCGHIARKGDNRICLLYTSDAADGIFV